MLRLKITYFSRNLLFLSENVRCENIANVGRLIFADEKPRIGENKMIEKNGNQTVRTSEIEWQPLPEENAAGVYVKSLLFDDETGRSPTILLKFEAGATYPLHNHPGGEEIFVLEGAVKVGKDFLKAGDYLYTAVNNAHRVSTENGCVVLLKAAQEVEIIEPRRSKNLAFGD